MNTIDKIDEQLIRLIEQNARQSSEILARQLNVSSATVRRRLKKLIDSNVLNIMAIKNPIKMGLSIAALIGFNIDHALIDSVMKAIRERPDVLFACTTTGRFDAFAFIRCHSNEEFSHLLRNGLTKIEGIKDMETFVCLHMEKPLGFY